MSNPDRRATALLTLLLTITAVIGALYGVVTLLTPAAYLQMLGLDPNPSAILQTRYFGAAVLGAGLMLGMARKARVLVVPALPAPASEEGKVMALLSSTVA
jgi:ABC-type transport system involved in multi-copper enzyme maturation permease subunit